MTDKEVIIDGVNVAGCEHCTRVCQNTKEPQAICELYRYCTNNPNCIYKQSQRLQAENEELKKTNISLWAREDITEKMLFNCNHRLQSYKQALEKIEDLATSGYLKDSRFCEAKELQQILTIINEELKEE